MGKRSKSARKSVSSSNRYKITLTLKFSIEKDDFDLTTARFNHHLRTHLNQSALKELTNGEKVYNIKFSPNAKVYFEVNKNKIGNTKKDVERHIKTTSLADSAWETRRTNFWKIVDDDEEAVLVKIKDVKVAE